MSPVKLWIQSWTRGAQETLWYPFCSSKSFFSVFVGSPKNLKQLTNTKGEFSIDGNPSFSYHTLFQLLYTEKKTEQISASSQTIPHCHMLNQIRATGLWRYSAESRRGTKCPTTFSKYSATPEHVFTVRIKAFSGIQFKKSVEIRKINEMPLNA